MNGKAFSMLVLLTIAAQSLIAGGGKYSAYRVYQKAGSKKQQMNQGDRHFKKQAANFFNKKNSMKNATGDTRVKVQPPEYEYMGTVNFSEEERIVHQQAINTFMMAGFVSHLLNPRG